jgi:hypothetical protein
MKQADAFYAHMVLQMSLTDRVKNCHVDLIFCLKQKLMLKSYDFMLNSPSLFHVSKSWQTEKRTTSFKSFEPNKAPTL